MMGMDLQTIIVLCIYYFILYCAVFWLIVYLKNRDKLWKDPKPPKKLPLVSLLIPAYNEDKTIAETIKACLNLDYPKNKLEIIVINDGSRDNTKKICEKFSKKGLIKLLNQKNQGKASALNNAIKIAKGEIIGCMDADSYFQKESLKNMIGYFNDPEISAVTPNMKVHDPQTWVQKIQWIEYLFGIYLRKLMSMLNCLHVTPGPGSLYRADALRKVGGFDPNNLTEDMDIAFKIQCLGKKITNSLNAISYTSTPKRFIDLLKQRVRWYGGYIENAKKYKFMMFNPKYKSLGFFMLPSNIVWIVSILLLLYVSLSGMINNFLKGFRQFGLIKFDLLPFFKIPELNISVLDINFMWVFGIILSSISFFIIYLSVKISSEKIDFKKKFKHYMYYLLFYWYMLSFFWVSTLVYKAVKRGNTRW